MRRFLNRLNDQGYTLIESLFQLLIFAVFVQLLLLFFLWKAPIERNFSQMSNTGWELFALDFQEVLVDVHDFELHTGGHGIRLWNNRGRIDIEHGNAVIRKRIDGLGHVPFLTNVHSANFSLNGSTLLVKVTMLDGTRKERDFAVGLYPE